MNNGYLIVSDIHGNYRALKHMVDIPEFSNSKIIFGGDYIDGYGVNESDKVVDFIADQYQHNNATVLPGNHELLLYKYIYGERRDWELYKANGGKRTVKSFLGEATRSSVSNKVALRDNKYWNQLDSMMGHCFDIRDTVVMYEDSKLITVHAGLSYIAEDYHNTNLWDSLWMREDYFYGLNTKYHNDNYFARNKFNKPIVVGHTPTCNLEGILPTGTQLHYTRDDLECPVVVSKYEDEKPRFFIDGGSHGATNSLNVLYYESEDNYGAYKLTPEGLTEGEIVR